MKIALNMIEKELSGNILEKNLYNMGSQMIYDFSEYYIPHQPFQKHGIYFIEGVQLSHLSDLPDETALVFCSDVTCSMPPGVPFLRFSADTSLLEISNQLNRIFRKYNAWEASLMKYLEEDNLQNMADCSFPIFHNDITMYDATYQQMYDLPGRDDPTGLIPLDTLNFFKSDRLFNQVRDLREVFEYPASILPVPCWCKNLFYQNEYYCRIVVQIHNPAPPCLPELLEIFSSYVGKYIDRHIASGEQVSFSPLSHFLKEIILGKEVPLEKFKHSLASLGWFPNSSYMAGYLLLSKGDYRNKTSDYYCLQLMHNYSGLCCFTLDDHIAFVLNLDFYQSSFTEFMSKFSYTLREGNFRVGFSNPFQDFYNLKYYYQQAQIAVLSGIQSDETIWSHRFSEHALSYIIQEAAHALPPSFLCAQELLTLREYDEKNNSSYYLTLKTYLELNQNAVHTAKALYIHQATMVYRLKRLKELIPLDFHNPNQLLYLRLSFLLLEQ